MPNHEEGVPDVPEIGERGRNLGSNDRPMSYPAAAMSGLPWPEPPPDLSTLQDHPISGTDASTQRPMTPSPQIWPVKGISDMFDHLDSTRPLTPPRRLDDQYRLGVLPSPARSAFSRDVHGSPRSPQEEMISSVVRHNTPPVLVNQSAPPAPVQAAYNALTGGEDKDRTPTQDVFGDTSPKSATQDGLGGLATLRAPNRASNHQRVVSLLQPEDIVPNDGKMEEPVSPISPEDGEEGFPADLKPVAPVSTMDTEVEDAQDSRRPSSSYSNDSTGAWEKVSHPGNVGEEIKPATSGASMEVGSIEHNAFNAALAAITGKSATPAGVKSVKTETEAPVAGGGGSMSGQSVRSIPGRGSMEASSRPLTGASVEIPPSVAGSAMSNLKRPATGASVELPPSVASTPSRPVTGASVEMPPSVAGYIASHHSRPATGASTLR